MTDQRVDANTNGHAAADSGWVRRGQPLPRSRKLETMATPLEVTPPGVFDSMGDGKMLSPLARSWAGQGPATFFVRTMLAGDESVERPFEENVWVRSALKAVSEGIAQITLRIYSADPTTRGDAPEITTGELYRLLNDPNPITTANEFWQQHAVNFKLDGENYLFMADADGMPVPATASGVGMPTQIVQVRGSLVEHDVDNLGMPSKYRFPLSDGQWSASFPRDSVVSIRDYNPDQPVRGLGDVQAARREIESYLQVQRYMDGSIENGGDPGAWVTLDSYMSSEERLAREDQLNDDQSVQNRGRTKLLPRGSKVTPNPVSPRDMEYRQYMMWLRDSILAALGVPPPMVGILEDSTYNNIRTAEQMMWTGPNGIVALVRKTERTLRKLFQRITGQQNVWPAFDLGGVEVLQRDLGPQVEAAHKVVRMGTGVSLNEALDQHGIDGVESEIGDQRWVDSQLRPMESVVQEFGDSEQTAAPTETLNGAQIAELRTIVENVSAGLLPKASAEQIIVTSFPIDAARAKAILASVVEGSTSGAPDQAQADRGAPAHIAAINRLASKGIEPHPGIKAAVLRWLRQYEVAQLSRLRGIAGAHTRADLTKADISRMQVNNEAWRDILSMYVNGPVEDSWADALKAMASEGVSPFTELTDPRVVDAIATQRMELVESVSGTTTKRVRAAFIRAMTGTADRPLTLEVKDALPKLTHELAQVFESKEQRAETIARTEMGRTQNQLTYEEARRAGAKTIRWVNSGDGAVRPTHQIDEVIDFGERFSTGLLYPSEPGGAASEVINCRCTFDVVDYFDIGDAPGLSDADMHPFPL